jgi:serine/threonine protein kinase
MTGVNIDYHTKLGQGSYGAVYACTVQSEGAKRIKQNKHCIKLASSQLQQQILRAECETAYRLRGVDRCVRIEGMYTKRNIIGMVMERFDGTMWNLIQKACTDLTSDQQKLEILQWSANELVLALLSMHNAGVTHGDIKLSNIGCSTPKRRHVQRPWESSIVRMIDFGGSECGLSAGTYPFKAANWSTNPEQLLMGDTRLDESILYRRNDWFQSLMVIFDIAHRVCTKGSMSLESQWRDTKHTKTRLQQVGDDWIASGRRGGWLNCMIQKCQNETGRIPRSVVDLYNNSDVLRTVDQQLTMNFKTCI